MFEGGEACGKSTQAAILAETLGALLTREPGGTATGEHIRALLLDPARPDISARAETLLLLAARAQHVVEVIAPALGAGRTVVCDRFSGSTLAYQGYGRGLDLEPLARMSAWASNGTEPDVIVLLTLGAEEARARRAARGGVDRMEGAGADFFTKVDSGYEALAASDPAHWRVVDGTGSVEDVAGRVAVAVAG